LFAEVLGLKRVGGEDDLFDLGGSSSDAEEVIVRLSEFFDRGLEISDFLRAPTPAALALRMTEPPSRPAGSLIPLHRGDGLPVFFFPAPNRGSLVRLAHRDLARGVAEKRPFLAFDPGERSGLSASDLVDMALWTLRAMQPQGPYALIGECAAGNLAWEIARRLSDEGEPVSLLALLDSPWRPYWRQPGSRSRRDPGWWRGGLIHRAKRHLRALRGLSAKQWPAYVCKKLVVAHATLRRVRSPETARRRRLRERYAEALGAVPLRPWPGRLCFVRSADRQHRRDVEGWATLAGSLEVVSLPVEHRSLLGVHVDQVAAALSSWLHQS
jgi:thioesterase domain-containing protein